MIQLTRIRTKPPIPARYCGTERERMEGVLFAARHGGDTSFLTSHWKPAKKQLKIESNGKCAYCEARVGTVAHGDVEHFRPKDIYWWLAYCYDNYLFACQICNQSFKSNHFPVHGTQLSGPSLSPASSAADLQALVGRFAPDPLDAPSIDVFLKAAKKEKSGLPDPYAMDPEPLFAWQPDEDNHCVRIAARDSRVASKRAFAAVEKFLGLNRDELMGERWRTYSQLKLNRDSLSRIESAFGAADPVAVQIRQAITSMMAASAQFAAMARYFVKIEWNLAGF